MTRRVVNKQRKQDP